MDFLGCGNGQSDGKRYLAGLGFENQSKMKRRGRMIGALVAAVFAAVLGSCSENPFGGDKISSGERLLTGRVALQDGSTPEGVFVWLQGVNLSTFTDEKGEFKILLPPEPGSPAPGTIQTDTVFFYLANYWLESASVVIAEGEFLFGREDVTDDGEIRGPVVMRRFLKIKTDVQPGAIALNSSEPIEVTVSLQGEVGCAVVVNPGIVVKDKFLEVDTLGAILLRGIESGKVFVYRSNPGADGNEQLRVCEEPVRRKLTFDLTSMPLPAGDYEVIPYLSVNPKGVPRELLEKLGFHVNNLGADYLKKPMRREDGHLKVMGSP